MDAVVVKERVEYTTGRRRQGLYRPEPIRNTPTYTNTLGWEHEIHSPQSACGWAQYRMPLPALDSPCAASVRREHYLRSPDGHRFQLGSQNGADSRKGPFREYSANVWALERNEVVGSGAASTVGRRGSVESALPQGRRRHSLPILVAECRSRNLAE